MSISKSKRTEFTAAHLTPETKDALTKKARREKKSVSAVVSEAVEEKLKQEKTFEKWTYLVSKWTVDPLLKERKELLAEKKDEKKTETSVPPTELTPPIAN